jgi:bifunctional ADP-heptose synthase (sugar kinase/adenylyltransferase)
MVVLVGIAAALTAGIVVAKAGTTMVTAAPVMMTATAAGVKRTLLAVRDCAQPCAVP